jgi:hypothetical protein
VPSTSVLSTTPSVTTLAGGESRITQPKHFGRLALLEGKLAEQGQDGEDWLNQQSDATRAVLG